MALTAIPGYIPRPDRLPEGCIFAPRCLGAEPACRAARPPLQQAEGPAEGGHLTACRRWQALRATPRVFQVPQEKREPAEAAAAAGPVVLRATGVRKHFPVSGVGLMRLHGRPMVRAVDDISVQVGKGFTLGIVGESGCGKTTLARCIAGLEPADAGSFELEGQPLPRSVSRRSRNALRRLQMVFQSPDASLNPQVTVGAGLGRPLALLGGLRPGQVKQRVRELLEAVSLPPEYIGRLPHELSGGEKQRVAIARAFATDPALMICDEPISSLDVSVQASLLNLLADLQESRGTSYLFISHDLAAVRHLSDWIAVIYLGRLWEIGAAAEVFAPPQHPYTEALLSALPAPDPETRYRRGRIRLRGSVPSAVRIPSGCRFHTRCPRKIGAVCETQEPPWQDNGHSHRICCHIPVAELREMQKAGGP